MKMRAADEFQRQGHVGGTGAASQDCFGRICPSRTRQRFTAGEKDAVENNGNTVRHFEHKKTNSGFAMSIDGGEFAFAKFNQSTKPLINDKSTREIRCQYLTRTWHVANGVPRTQADAECTRQQVNDIDSVLSEGVGIGFVSCGHQATAPLPFPSVQANLRLASCGVHRCYVYSFVHHYLSACTCHGTRMSRHVCLPSSGHVRGHAYVVMVVS